MMIKRRRRNRTYAKRLRVRPHVIVFDAAVGVKQRPDGTVLSWTSTPYLPTPLSISPSTHTP